MSTSQEINGHQSSRIKEFLQMVYDILKLGHLPKPTYFTVDGPDFLFDYNDEIMAEAPKTGDLIETGDFVDDMDGWQSWIEGVGYNQESYISALQHDFDEALALYQKETNTTWKPS